MQIPFWVTAAQICCFKASKDALEWYSTFIIEI